jgi:hypothetical protein
MSKNVGTDAPQGTLEQRNEAFLALLAAAYPRMVPHRLELAREVPPTPDFQPAAPDTADRDWLYLGSNMPPRVGAILRATAEVSGVSRHDLIGPARHRHLVRWRQAAIWLARDLITASYSGIGRVMGGRDHSTVMHSVERVRRHKSLYADHIARIRDQLQRMHP